MKPVKHLGISGGGTKIYGLSGAARQVIEYYGYYPHYYTGISAGAILAIPLALRMFEEIEKITKNMTLDTFFSEKPVNENNKISMKGLIRALTGKSSLGHMGNLYKILNQIITPETFEKYKSSSNTFIAFVGYVDAKTAGRKYINLKETDYDTAIKSIVASSTIPIFTAPVKVGEDLGIDGGVRDHIGTPWILEEKEIDQTISIYSRPKELDGYLDSSWKDENIINIIQRTLEILMIEISKSDEKIEDEICEKKKIKQKKIYLPKIMQGFYDVNPKRLEDLFKGAVINAKQIMDLPW